MCYPIVIPIAMALMSAYSAKVQGDTANEVAEQTAIASNIAAQQNYQQLDAQREEVDEAAAQDKLQRQLQTKREHGTITVAAGEAGVGGNSVMKVMGNAFLQGSYDVAVIEANRVSKARQITAKKISVHASNKGAINVAEAQTQSTGAQITNIGIAGVQGYMSGKALSGSLFGGATMPTDPNVSFGSTDAYTSNVGIR